MSLLMDTKDYKPDKIYKFWFLKFSSVNLFLFLICGAIFLLIIISCVNFAKAAQGKKELNSIVVERESAKIYLKGFVDGRGSWDISNNVEAIEKAIKNSTNRVWDNEK